MTTFRPRPCPCGCKKWIMAPTFACQCSSVSTVEKDDLMAMQRDALRYRALRNAKKHDVIPDPCDFHSAIDKGGDELDYWADRLAESQNIDPFIGRNHAS